MDIEKNYKNVPSRIRSPKLCPQPGIFMNLFQALSLSFSLLHFLVSGSQCSAFIHVSYELCDQKGAIYLKGVKLRVSKVHIIVND